jgi:ribonuclease D
MNLTTWRDGIAKKMDRPRGHIIKDTTLLDIARKKPRSLPELKNGIEISENAITKYGDNIAAIIDTTLNQPEDTFPALQRPARLSSTDREALEKLNKLITLKAGLLGIAPGLVGNVSELKMLVKMLNSKKIHEAKQLRQTEGWRKCFLEDFFRQSRI